MEALAREFRSRVAREMSSTKRRTRYPADLRALAVRYADEAQVVGHRRQRIADTLGISFKTLEQWRSAGGGRKDKSKLVRLGTVGEISMRGGVVVHGPGGIRVDGLDASGVAQVLRALM